MYQILSQSVRFCRLYIKKHFGVFFGLQCIRDRINTEFYQNRPGFVDDVTKNIRCVLGFAVPIAVHLQNMNSKVV